jgi:hypothetical protein
MATQRKKNQSIFPDFPRHTPIVDKDGRLTATWHLSLASLYQALQTTFSNEGFAMPPLSLDDQATILAIYTALIGKPNGLHTTNPSTPNISGQRIYSIGSGTYGGGGYVAPCLKVFIIEFATATDPTSVIKAASWKTLLT